MARCREVAALPLLPQAVYQPWQPVWSGWPLTAAFLALICACVRPACSAVHCGLLYASASSEQSPTSMPVVSESGNAQEIVMPSRLPGMIEAFMLELIEPPEQPVPMVNLIGPYRSPIRSFIIITVSDMLTRFELSEESVMLLT